MSAEGRTLQEIHNRMIDAQATVKKICQIDTKISQISNQSSDKVLHWLIEERTKKRKAIFAEWAEEMIHVKNKFAKVLDEKKQLLEELEAKIDVSTFNLLYFFWDLYMQKTAFW